jgi:hypothetical protein
MREDAKSAITFARQTEQLFNPLLSQDVLRTFSSAVQPERLHFIQRNAVGDGASVRALYMELAALAERRQRPNHHGAGTGLLLCNSLVEALRFYFHRVVNSFDLSVADSAECHERSLSVRLIFAFGLAECPAGFVCCATLNRIETPRG